jgi:hypothetical protein
MAGFDSTASMSVIRPTMLAGPIVRHSKGRKRVSGEVWAWDPVGAAINRTAAEARPARMCRVRIAVLRKGEAAGRYVARRIPVATIK